MDPRSTPDEVTVLSCVAECLKREHTLATICALGAGRAITSLPVHSKPVSLSLASGVTTENLHPENDADEDAVCYSAGGFLVHGETVDEVRARDNETLALLNVTHAQVAAALISALGQYKLVCILGGEPHGTDMQSVPITNALSVRRTSWDGSQECPFCVGLDELISGHGGKMDKTEIATGEKEMSVPGLMSHLVGAHHFFEGSVPHRVDPALCAQILGVTSASPGTVDVCELQVWSPVWRHSAWPNDSKATVRRAWGWLGGQSIILEASLSTPAALMRISWRPQATGTSGWWVDDAGEHCKWVKVVAADAACMVVVVDGAVLSILKDNIGASQVYEQQQYATPCLLRGQQPQQIFRWNESGKPENMIPEYSALENIVIPPPERFTAEVVAEFKRRMVHAGAGAGTKGEDFDVVQLCLTQALGILGDTTVNEYKAVYWTDNALGRSLQAGLDGLVRTSVLVYDDDAGSYALAPDAPT